MRAYTASDHDFGATADRYNRQIAQNRLAGIRGVGIQFRGTHRNRLQSLVALTIHRERVIVTFSCEVTVLSLEAMSKRSPGTPPKPSRGADSSRPVLAGHVLCGRATCGPCSAFSADLQERKGGGPRSRSQVSHAICNQGHASHQGSGQFCPIPWL